MIWLNYQHLYYFWTAVRHGGVTAACDRLRLAPSTVSAQIHMLEENLGHPLMKRAGRKLVPTEFGSMVYGYADRIFALGQELMDCVENEAAARVPRVYVGIVDALPKLLAHFLIAPALHMKPKVYVSCREGSAAQLLSQLATGDLDVVLSDSPVSPEMKVKAYSHRLGRSGVSFLGAPKLASRYARNFPRSLEGAPLLVPTEHTPLRTKLDQWLREKHLRPLVIGEFEDHAMLRAFAESGVGIVPIPSLVVPPMLRGGALKEIGRTKSIQFEFYGITTERKLAFAPVVAICRKKG